MRETQGGASWRWEGRSTLSLEYIDLHDYKSTTSVSGMLARIMLTVPTMSEIHLTMQQAFAEASNMMKDDSKCVMCLQAEAVVAMLPCGHRCVCESCATIRLSNRPSASTQRPVDPKKALDGDQHDDPEAGSPEISIERGWSGIEKGFSEIFEQVPFCPICRQPVSDTKRIYG